MGTGSGNLMTKPMAKKKALKKPLIPDADKPYLTEDEGKIFTVSMMNWLCIQALIEILVVVVVLCLPRVWMSPILNLSFYDHLIWGARGLVILGLLLTMPECSKSSIIG